MYFFKIIVSDEENIFRILRKSKKKLTSLVDKKSFVVYLPNYLNKL